jgi:hypothetical protein
MRFIALAFVALVVTAGCGSGSGSKTATTTTVAAHGLSNGDEKFLHEIGDSGSILAAAQVSLDACNDTACLHRVGPVMQRTADTQTARVRQGLTGLDSDCVRQAGRSYVEVLLAYRAAGALAGRGRKDASADAESHAGTLAIATGRKVDECTGTHGASNATTRALGAVHDQLTRVVRCNDAACFAREGSKLRNVADDQQRVVDAQLAQGNACDQKAQGPFDRSFDAIRRVADDLKQADATALTTDGPRSELLISAAMRAFRSCA